MSAVAATLERPAAEEKGRGGRIVLYVVLAVFAVVFLVPVYVAIVTSLKGTQEVATGGIWEGIVLIAFGTLVIGLVDNVLRPILVGGDTKLPDYVVLISTLGGIAVFGVNGFVIGPVIAALFVASWEIVAASRTDAPMAPSPLPPVPEPTLPPADARS